MSIEIPSARKDRISLVASVLLVAMIALQCGSLRADPVLPRTTLDRKNVTYTVPKSDYIVLRRAGVEAVIVDNRDVDGKTLPGHRAGYSGVASLTHAKQPRNLFVPAYAGLNFEHIHDGTVQERDVLFEPRKAPMELRIINEHAVELYQKPTPYWQLESCHRYALLPDGVIEMTFECIPRKRTFKHDYIGLFWASYIHQPESLDIHFQGIPEKSVGNKHEVAKWIRGVTPAHGTLPTHLGVNDQRKFKHDEKFPLTLAFNRSKHRFTEPWYYGVSHGMAFVLCFREQDQVRLTQSPSGGGNGNPAWDFQFFISNYKVNHRYQYVMRAIYVPFENHEQIARLARQHVQALRGQTSKSR